LPRSYSTFRSIDSHDETFYQNHIYCSENAISLSDSNNLRPIEFHELAADDPELPAIRGGQGKEGGKGSGEEGREGDRMVYAKTYI